jgi:hypothetical protein
VDKNRVARWFIYIPKHQLGGPLEWKMLVYLMSIWNILRPFGIPTLRRFGIVCGHVVCLGQEISGYPGLGKKSLGVCTKIIELRRAGIWNEAQKL